MLQNQKSKIWRSKRGDDMIIDFWAIFMFAIILIIFLMIFSIDRNANENKVQAKFVNKDVNFMLESFLRAPALGPGMNSTKTVGEIIVEDSTNDNFDNTQKLFEAYFSRIDEMNGFKVNIIQIDIKGQHDSGISIYKNKALGRAALNILRSSISIVLSTMSVSPVPIIKEGRADAYTAETYLPGYNEKVYVRLSVSETILVSELKAAQAKEDAKTNGK